MIHALFGFSGRIGRQTFWLSIVALVVLISVLYIIAGIFLGFPQMNPNQPPDFSHPFYKAYFGISLLSLWPSLAISVKRLHDRDRRGWWLLLPYALMLIAGAMMMMNPAMMMVPGDLAAPIPGQTPMSPGPMIAFGIAMLLSMIAMLWLFIVLGFLRGSNGPNRFGADPLGGSGAGEPVPPAGHDWAN